MGFGFEIIPTCLLIEHAHRIIIPRTHSFDPTADLFSLVKLF